MATQSDNNHAAITLRSATRDSRNAFNHAHINNHSLQISEGEPIRARFDPSCTRRTHEVPSIAGRGHFIRKNIRFPAPAFPQNKAHATSMQPLQYVLQHQVPNPHLSKHILVATQTDNNHAAITLRSATRDSRNAFNHAHINNHSLQNTEEEPIRARFDPSRTRRTHEVPFIAGRSHFTRKNIRFPAPAFPQNEAHATSMQPLQCVLQPQVPNPHLPTHMATQSDNNHAAITLRSATRESRNAFNHAHINNHSLQKRRGNRFALGSTPAAPAAHTRYLPSPAGATSYGKT